MASGMFSYTPILQLSELLWRVVRLLGAIIYSTYLLFKKKKKEKPKRRLSWDDGTNRHFRSFNFSFWKRNVHEKAELALWGYILTSTQLLTTELRRKKSAGCPSFGDCLRFWFFWNLQRWMLNRSNNLRKNVNNLVILSPFLEGIMNVWINFLNVSWRSVVHVDTAGYNRDLLFLTPFHPSIQGA